MSKNSKEYSKSYYHKNKEKFKNYHKKYYQKNRNKILLKAKEEQKIKINRILNRKRYGVSNPTSELKTGECEICKRECKLVYDHDHKTSKFRVGFVEHVIVD